MRRCVLLVTLLVFAASVVAADPPLKSLGKKKLTQVGAPDLPTDPAQWINGTPLTLEGLKGKAALFWFFEEKDCKPCKDKWIELMALSKKHEKDPIVFIAVNSGTPRPALEAYIKEVNLTWPMIADTSREFEKAAGLVGDIIHLQNAIQCKVLTPDGKLHNAPFNNTEGSAKAALEGASWKVDAESIPASLKKTWQMIEFGNYAGAAKALKTALASEKTDVKEAADKLEQVVRTEMHKELAAAQKLAENGEKFEAYRAYIALSERYLGFDMPTDVATGKTELAADSAVKEELAAYKALELVRKNAASDRTPTKSKTVGALRRLINEKPNSGAAGEAKEMLTALGAKDLDAKKTPAPKGKEKEKEK